MSSNSPGDPGHSDYAQSDPDPSEQGQADTGRRAPQRDPGSAATDRPPRSTDGGDNAAARFQQHVQSKQSSLEDYDPEEELWTGGYSGKAMVGTWLLLTLISVALLIAPAFIDQLTFLIALAVVLVIWAIGGLVYAWRRLGVHYQLTSQRFIHQVGILTRRTDRIEVIDIDDVSFTQGPVQRMFGVGTIVLTGSDRTHPTLSMIGIGNVKEVAGLIDDVRRQERRRRSLHIESI